MKKYVGVLAVSVVLLLSCTEEEHTCHLTGQLVGSYMEECNCCNGWLIYNNSDTSRYMSYFGDDTYSIVKSFGYSLPVSISYIDIGDSSCSANKELSCIHVSYPKDCSSAGEIIGYDDTECAWCPGWFIKTNDETIRIYSLPEENIIWGRVNSSGYPIKPKLSAWRVTNKRFT